MGSGKTAVGKLLAQKTRRQFIDLDRAIEESTRKTITQLFDEYSEEHFRQIEHETLKQTVTNTNAIIATGGGTPCFMNNMELINNSGISIYLETSPEIIVNRLNAKIDSRPLLKNILKQNLISEVGRMLALRKPNYEEAAMIFNTDKMSEEEIAKAILRKL